MKMSGRAVGRLAGVLHLLCGGYVVAVSPFLSTAPGGRPGMLMVMGLVTAFAGLIWSALPWDRWPHSATLVMVVEALALVSFHGFLIGADGYRFTAFYMVIFAWVGLTQPRWVPTLLSPLLLISYALPVFYGPHGSALAIGGAVYAIPVCVLVGETIAWVTQQHRREQEARHVSDQFLRAAFDNASVGSIVVDVNGTIVQANRVLEELLCYEPGAFTGMALVDLIHEEDREGTFAEGRRLTATVGLDEIASAQPRMVRRDGGTVWVDLNASLARDGDGAPAFVVAQVQDITDRRSYEARLSYQAHYDALTGLPNRVLLLDRVHQAVSRATATTNSPPALLFVDLDNFKFVNDSQGHSAGDALLVAVAARLEQLVTPADTVARLGGDEFVVLCDPPEGPSAVDALASLIQSDLAAGFETTFGHLSVSASIGIAVADGTATSAEVLLRDADTAMYEAKQRGRARHEVFDAPLRQRLLTRVRTETDLRNAIGSDQFFLCYQPQFDLHRGGVLGAEALLRWNRPGHGEVQPASFIGIAEDSGLIVPIGEWVLHEAPAQAARWAEDGTPLPISVNLSGRQLGHPTIVATVDSALRHSGLDSSLLCLEVTESMLLGDADGALQVLGELKARGVRLSLDDFGTGYSSMAYLQRFPFDELKIDQSFVSDLAREAGDPALVTAIIDMAEALGLEVVAEGIEHPRQATVLRSLGCRTAQGFLLSRPIVAGKLSALLVANRAGRGGRAESAPELASASELAPQSVASLTSRLS
ncbi:hypothetical protein BH24ACT3_BH24ACT3_04150 [soil metagenome]